MNRRRTKKGEGHNDVNIDEKDDKSGIVGVFGNQAKAKNKDKGKDTDNDEEVKIDKKMIDKLGGY